MLDPVSWVVIEDNKAIRSKQDATSLLPGKLKIIDQTLLPETLSYLETDDLETIFDAIKRLAVRGAPAIGCAAALGLAAVAQHSTARFTCQFLEEVQKQADYLASSRPTAVNLSWALNRCMEALSFSDEDDIETLKHLLIEEALDILEEDITMCRSIGKHGSTLLKKGMGVITHCNAGALATGDYGTALSPIYIAKENGINVHVFSDETRPLLQGSRLTAWELHKAGIPVTTICDNMAAQVMREKRIDIAIVGADRVAANGDAANKIGTYGLAILAKYHNIPFYVAIPYSTIDMSLDHGDKIPIEKRSPEEVRNGMGRLTAPNNVDIYNPAFDVTPHELITGIITERGILYPPFNESIAALFN